MVDFIGLFLHFSYNSLNTFSEVSDIISIGITRAKVCRDKDGRKGQDAG